MRNNNNSTRSAATKVVVTAGEVLGDGTMIELVAGLDGYSQPNLLFWDGRKAKIGSNITHRGLMYEPIKIDANFYSAIRLPKTTACFSSVRVLFDAIANLFVGHLDLEDTTCALIAGFVMSTWLRDQLPQALHLAMSGWDEGLGVDVLRLLHCVCRHGLLIGEITAASLRRMPMHLAPTLILNQMALHPTLRRLLRSSCYRGLRVPGTAGQLLDLHGAKALFCTNDLAFEAMGGQVLQVQLPAVREQRPTLDEKTLHAIADRFQPQLLMYRFKSMEFTHASEPDLSHFTPGMHASARALSACLQQDPERASEVVKMLLPQDEEARRKLALCLDYIIVEVLLGMLHEKRECEVSVKELAKFLNSLLRDRGEVCSYSPESVGRRLGDMDIQRQRDRHGQHVVFDRATSSHIHRKAQTCGLLTESNGRAECPACCELFGPGTMPVKVV